MLKGPCHAFPVITITYIYTLCVMKVFMHVNGMQSQTLKAHPVASKTLTQKRPVYAASERLVGDFSFSIVYFLGSLTCEHPNQQQMTGLAQMDQSTEHLTHQDPLAN